jgi:hypothetical protein
MYHTRQKEEAAVSLLCPLQLRAHPGMEEAEDEGQVEVLSNLLTASRAIIALEGPSVTHILSEMLWPLLVLLGGSNTNSAKRETGKMIEELKRCDVEIDKMKGSTDKAAAREDDLLEMVFLRRDHNEDTAQ